MNYMDLYILTHLCNDDIFFSFFISTCLLTLNENFRPPCELQLRENLPIFQNMHRKNWPSTAMPLQYPIFFFIPSYDRCRSCRRAIAISRTHKPTGHHRTYTCINNISLSLSLFVYVYARLRLWWWRFPSRVLLKYKFVNVCVTYLLLRIFLRI